MQKLTIVKLGGSVITDKSKPLIARRSEIRRLGREILASKFKGKLIITHGSGSFGHPVAKKYKTHEGYKNDKSIRGMVLTSDAAIEINRIVMKEFIKLGMNVKSLASSSFLIAKDKKIQKGFIDPLMNILKSDVIPVTFGDVVMDKEQGFCIISAEKIIYYMVDKLSKEYSTTLIIYCSDTDGVYDESGETIPKISSKNFKNVRQMIGRSGSADVTGGMLHKVKESLKLAKNYKLEVRIINGKRIKHLKRALEGKKVVSTTILN